MKGLAFGAAVGNGAGIPRLTMGNLSIYEGWSFDLRLHVSCLCVHPIRGYSICL